MHRAVPNAVQNVVQSGLQRAAQRSHNRAWGTGQEWGSLLDKYTTPLAESPSIINPTYLGPQRPDHVASSPNEPASVGQSSVYVLVFLSVYFFFTWPAVYALPMFPSDPLWPYNDVAAGSREHGDWLASNVRARLCREVDAAGGWFQYIAGEKFKEVAFMQEGVYADCLQRKTEASDDARHQIDLDLHRTVITEKGDSPLIAPLAQVLSAYAVHNPKVGYCQGMNFITAMCLHVMTQEEAFWVLAYMAERVVPDYFSNMEGAIADKACIDWMLGISAPELSHKLEQFEGLPTIMWQALLCVFANNIVPTEAVFVFWAALFNKGRVFLVRVICQLLANCSGVILAADSTEDIRAGVTAYMNTLYDAVSVVAAVDQDAWDDPGRPCWLAYPSAKIWKQRDALMHSYKQELADHQQDLELMHVARATRLPVELLTRWSTEFHWVCRQGARKGPAAKGMAFPAFRKVMHNVGFDSQTLNLAKLFELWDKSGSRTVHFLELVTGLVTLSDKASIQGRLHICFSTYDVNDSGCLEAEEVQAMMASRHWCEVLGSPGARSLFDADGTVQGCNFCYVLAAFEALPLTLRDGVKLSSTVCLPVLQESTSCGELLDPSGEGVSGTGAQGRGVSGTGAQGRGVSGTGAQGRGVSGTGAQGRGVSGTGAQGRGVSGTGAQGRGVSGTGAQGRGSVVQGHRGGVSGTGAQGRDQTFPAYPGPGHDHVSLLCRPLVQRCCQGLPVFEVAVGQQDVSLLPSLPCTAERRLKGTDMSHVCGGGGGQMRFFAL